MLQRKFDFHKGFKIFRCCLGSPGKSGEAHPYLVASLAKPLVIKFKVDSCLHFLKRISIGRRSLVSATEIIASVIKYILTFLPVSSI